MKELVKRFETLSRRRNRFQAFSDLVEIIALTIRNQVDKKDWEEREERYLQIIKGYSKEELDTISDIFGLIIIELDKEEVTDVIGEMYMMAEVSSKDLGQFFTPIHISKLMAEIVIDEEQLKRDIKEVGYTTVSEPTAGSGVNIIALYNKMKQLGYNPQNQLLAEAIDIDRTAVHILYIQLSLLGIPAKVVHGNTISLEVYDVWVTPFYYLNYNKFKDWGRKGVKVQ